MPTSLVLNSDQTEALQALSDFPDNFFVLKGYAGTGKTTVITRWVRDIRKRPIDYPPNKLFRPPKIVLTAPTNKAANVLSEKAAEINLPVDTGTIHSLLSLKMKWQDQKQILVQDSRGEDNFEYYDYVIIDECSMLNEELMEFILAAQQAANNKVIFMGDPCQLPPIGESESLSFSQSSEPLELTGVMRQDKDSGIQELALYLRDLILSGGKQYPAKIHTFIDDKTIIGLPAEQNQEQILRAFESAEAGCKDIRLVAWTNKVVDAWNRLIRERLYGPAPDEWTKGEQVVATGPILDPKTGDIIFTTDSLIKLTHEIKEDIVHEVPVWKLRSRGAYFYVVQRGSQQIYEQRRQAYLAAAKADKSKWREFYDFMESFSRIKPAHAMTVHRSQGSTFDDVFVHYRNILQNPRRKESLQCLYVAITRPRSRVFLI